MLILAEEPRLNVNLKAFRYGQGFFTTSRIYQGSGLWLNEHIQRLNHSLQVFAMERLDEKVVIDSINEWIDSSQINNGFLRIMVWEEQGESVVYINGASMNFSKPSRKVLGQASFYRHSSQPLAAFKTFNYWENQLAYQEAAEQGFYEALFCNEKGEICESSRCNIFWVKENKLYTPHKKCGLLEGIARKKILQLAEKLDIAVEEGGFELAEMECAEELFLTNSLRGIIEIDSYENKNEYSQKRPITIALKKAYQDEIDKYKTC